jgi:porphobilinogen deaminase
MPIAAFAELGPSGVTISSFVSDIAGETILKVDKQGPKLESYRLANEVTAELMAQGAEKIIEAGRN